MAEVVSKKLTQLSSIISSDIDNNDLIYVVDAENGTSCKMTIGELVQYMLSSGSIKISTDDKTVSRNTRNDLQAIGLINYNDNSDLKYTSVWIGTKAQYDEIADADIVDDRLYIVTDSNWNEDGLTVDSELSNTSTNPVQNRVITDALADIRSKNVSTIVIPKYNSSTASWTKVASADGYTYTYTLANVNVVLAVYEKFDGTSEFIQVVPNSIILSGNDIKIVFEIKNAKVTEFENIEWTIKCL